MEKSVERRVATGADQSISLAGKTALVTGGTSGIGHAVAELFAASGAAVLIAGRDRGRGEAAGAAIAARSEDATVRFVAADIADAGQCERLVGEAVQAFGGLDVLVNSAGVLHNGTAETISDAAWRETLDVNVSAVFYLSRAAVRAMKGRGGAIVNIASDWGMVGGPGAVAYCASKGAVLQMTRAMAIDHARDGIRVNSVCPGATDTPMLWNEYGSLGLSPADGVALTVKAIPLGRIAQPREIAPAMLILASDAARYITGAVLPVDGGSTAD